MRIRRDVSSLSPQQRKAFVNAVLLLKQQPSRLDPSHRTASAYDDFVSVHKEAVGAHRGPLFLAWHRAFVNAFELELQKIDHTVTIPYWDWTKDRVLSNLRGPLGIPFTADLLGGDGEGDSHEVTTGPFASWNLKRQLEGAPSAQGYPFSLPARAEVQAALDATSFDRFHTIIEGYHGDPPGLHIRVHDWVGGTMANVLQSPSDPVFWMHHANVDRLWARWREAHPEADEPFWQSEIDIYWSRLQAIDVVSHHNLGYAYADENLRRALRLPPFLVPAVRTLVIRGPSDPPWWGKLEPPVRDQLVGLVIGELATLVSRQDVASSLEGIATALGGRRTLEAEVIDELQRALEVEPDAPGRRSRAGDGTPR